MQKDIDETRRVIPSLNGLRAISILMVIAYHLNLNNFFPDKKIIKYFGILFFNGQLGVNIFFIISGFLITTLLINEKKTTGKISFKNFYLRRTFRIFPAYYFLLFIYLILNVAGYFNLDTLTWISVITFTKQFYKSGPYEISHLWSLSVEEVFYIMWPLLFVKAKKSITLITCLLIVSVASARFFQYRFPYSPWADTIFSTGDALLIGCLLAIKYQQIVLWIHQRKKLIFFALGCLIISVMTYVYLYHLIDKANNTDHLLNFSEALAYSLLGNIGLLTNLLIAYVIVFSINISNRWYQLLNTPIMNHIGKLSYSLYLWQGLLTADSTLLHKLPWPVIMILIYFLALFSYQFIEKPFLHLKNRINIKSALQTHH